MLAAIKPGFVYFALVFSAGFLLGTLRITLIVPRVGVRSAELLETPFMILISFLAARWVVRRQAVPYALTTRLRTGVIALALMLVAEFGFVLWLRGISLSQYFATRDPVSATAYYLALGAFALMPMVVGKK